MRFAVSRRRALGAIALGLTLGALSGRIARAAGGLAAGNGEPAPPLALRDLDGREVTLASFRGRTVLVNFWATWCAPCVLEMPSLNRLREQLAGEGFEVLAVNLQENAARIRPFVERLGLAFAVVRDHDGGVRSAWNVRAVPSSYVVDASGRIALVAVGELDWDAPEVVARVRQVMRRPGGVPAGSRAALFEMRRI